MQLTTKARYAVTAMVDIAILSNQYGSAAPIKLAQIADRQGIALNYLEQIFAKLKKAGLVSAIKGPGGGYQLAHGSKHTRIIDIIEAVEESISMTRCDATIGAGCKPDKAKCITHELWEGLTKEISNYLSGVTVDDVMRKGI